MTRPAESGDSGRMDTSSMDRTLVVDDSPTIRRMVMASLRDVCTGGFAEASSGLEAVSYTHLTLPTNREV